MHAPPPSPPHTYYRLYKRQIFRPPPYAVGGLPICALVNRYNGLNFSNNFLIFRPPLCAVLDLPLRALVNDG